MSDKRNSAYMMSLATMSPAIESTVSLVVMLALCYFSSTPEGGEGDDLVSSGMDVLKEDPEFFVEIRKALEHGLKQLDKIESQMRARMI